VRVFLGFLILLALFAAVPVVAQQEAGMEIRRGGTLFKIPVEVRDWEYVGVSRRLLESGEGCEDVLQHDLEYSDFIEVHRETFFLPGKADSTQMKRIQAVASGQVALRMGQVRLDAQLVDPATGRVIFRKTYLLGDPPERWAVHGFADDIILYLTGERGVCESRIAFVGDATGHKEIYLVDWDGARIDQKTDFRSITLSPAWSPGGDRLAFTSFAHGNPELLGLDLRSGKTWTISARRGMNSAPAWSPDGQHLAVSMSFEGNSEIYIMDPSGKDPRRLTFEPSIDTAPSFNPEGTRLVFTSDRSGEPQIYVMDTDGTNLRRLTFLSKHSDSARWSPKGDRIVFVALIDRDFDICTITPDGDPNSLVRLTGGGSGSYENPSWAPDGRHIVFSLSKGGTRRLYVMAADGTGIRQLTYARGDQYNPAWSPPLGLSGE
jgi:TolB protein